MSEQQIPSWVKPAAWGAVGGIVGITILAFSAGWIMTSGSAETMARTAARDAQVTALAPICLAQAQADPEYETKLAALEEESSYSRDDFVEDSGWVTFPGSNKPNEFVADLCAKMLLAPAA